MLTFHNGYFVGLLPRMASYDMTVATASCMRSSAKRLPAAGKACIELTPWEARIIALEFLTISRRSTVTLAPQATHQVIVRNGPKRAKNIVKRPEPATKCELVILIIGQYLSAFWCANRRKTSPRHQNRRAARPGARPRRSRRLARNNGRKPRPAASTSARR